MVLSHSDSTPSYFDIGVLIAAISACLSIVVGESIEFFILNLFCSIIFILIITKKSCKTIGLMSIVCVLSNLMISSIVFLNQWFQASFLVIALVGVVFMTGYLIIKRSSVDLISFALPVSTFIVIERVVAFL